MIDIRKEKVKKVLNDLTPAENFEFSELIQDERLKVEGSGIYKNNEPKKYGHRYYLYIDLKNNNTQKILTAIMLNPSEKSSNGGFDDTVSNVIKTAQKTGFSAVEVLNLFSYIEPDSTTASAYFKQDDKSYAVNQTNTDFIKKFLNTPDFNNPIMVAWGKTFINTTRHKQVKELIELLKDKNVYTFCNKNRKICKKIKDNYPKHPGRLNNFEEKCINNCHNGAIKLQKYNFEKESNGTK